MIEKSILECRFWHVILKYHLLGFRHIIIVIQQEFINKQTLQEKSILREIEKGKVLYYVKI